MAKEEPTERYKAVTYATQTANGVVDNTTEEQVSVEELLARILNKVESIEDHVVPKK